MPNRGAVCSKMELENFLRIMGCDMQEGRFCVDGDIYSFLGMGQEYVIGEDAVYYVNGEPVPLAGAYTNATGRGRATVIC